MDLLQAQLRVLFGRKEAAIQNNRDGSKMDMRLSIKLNCPCNYSMFEGLPLLAQFSAWRFYEPPDSA